jgi:HlyD family secretion protein
MSDKITYIEDSGQRLYPTQLPPNLVAGTGRIDGDIIALNTKYTGRIKTILIEEGQKHP